jgi:hypothetical protein
MSFLENKHASNSWIIMRLIFQNSVLKAINGIISHSKVFEDIFQNHFLSVPNLEFLLHYKFSKGHDANHQATNPGNK